MNNARFAYLKQHKHCIRAGTFTQAGVFTFAEQLKKNNRLIILRYHMRQQIHWLVKLTGFVNCFLCLRILSGSAIIHMKNVKNSQNFADDFEKY